MSSNLGIIETAFFQDLLYFHKYQIEFQFQYLSRARNSWDVNTIWHIAHHMLH
jgi:hypothetical protein